LCFFQVRFVTIFFFGFSKGLLRCMYVLVFIMRLSKVQNRKSKKGKQYYSYKILVPNSVIDLDLKWVEGDLRGVVKGGKLVIESVIDVE